MLAVHASPHAKEPLLTVREHNPSSLHIFLVNHKQHIKQPLVKSSNDARYFGKKKKKKAKIWHSKANVILWCIVVFCQKPDI